ncbi:C_GCAxxG_C_C family probable redox protein [Caloramator quimbayensis]|uniref:C_GCAxxG_C_C family probable redox protein n=1 Tax=Caloramator quimbayensis TaxID=1147123 RepID=A0A1T4XSG3_9CLOT|nr:C-GCAxxG-C-C family (seleno)protein [Caloramator quimbayensis]SKA92497.1 C_GCAxxG_C_C family probable redox protein [Caloramator quimbayensis]
MLINTARKFYSSEYDLNCAETILYAANEEYKMNLDKTVLKTMAAFGGGMAVEGVCGAISGAIAVLGILFTKERAHESDKIKNLTKEFIEKFTNRLGTENCAILKQRYRNDDIRCIKMIETAAEILDEIVIREMK